MEGMCTGDLQSSEKGGGEKEWDYCYILDETLM